MAETNLGSYTDERNYSEDPQYLQNPQYSQDLQYREEHRGGHKDKRKDKGPTYSDDRSKRDKRGKSKGAELNGIESFLTVSPVQLGEYFLTLLNKKKLEVKPPRATQATSQEKQVKIPNISQLQKEPRAANIIQSIRPPFLPTLKATVDMISLRATLLQHII
jgi:hypothetical protein